MSIPIYKQEKSKTCALACLRMILAYNGIDAQEKELLSYTKLHSFGISTLGLAEVANHYGFNCTGYTFKQDAYASLHLESNTPIPSGYEYKNKELGISVENYLGSKNNKLRFHYPTRKLLEIYLEQNIPLIATINNAAFGFNFKNLSSNHAVVIKKIKKDTIYYIDPWLGSEQSTDIDKFLTALTIAASKLDVFLMAISK